MGSVCPTARANIRQFVRSTSITIGAPSTPTAIVAVAWAISVGEGATANYADISSAGPIEHVYLGDDLSCQIRHSGDVFASLYPDLPLGDCGTLVAINGTLYGPDFFSHEGTLTMNLGSVTPFTPVSQSPVTGA